MNDHRSQPNKPPALIIAVWIYILTALPVLAGGLFLIAMSGAANGYGGFFLFIGLSFAIASAAMLIAAIFASRGNDASRVVLTFCGIIFLVFLGVTQNAFTLPPLGNSTTAALANWSLRILVQFGPALATILLWLPSSRAYFQQKTTLRRAA